MKIENPTTWLAALLDGCDPEKTNHGILEWPAIMHERWTALHQHIASGGALPEQWRGPGTAVGVLVSDARENAAIFRERKEILRNETIADTLAAETERWIAYVEGA